MKIVPTLLLLFLTSTASAQVDERLFADYVRSLVECCPGRSVVVFYMRTKGEPDKFLERLALGAAATKVPLDNTSRRYRTVIENNVSARIVAVAYDLEPDAVRVLSEVADAKRALSISSTEEDIYTTMFSFDSVAPDRFRNAALRFMSDADLADLGQSSGKQLQPQTSALRLRCRCSSPSRGRRRSRPDSSPCPRRAAR